MSQAITAIYEHGVFRPLQKVELPEGEQVALSVDLLTISAAAQDQLREWQEVYEGLADEDIAEVEALALDRSHFFSDAHTGAP